MQGASKVKEVGRLPIVLGDVGAEPNIVWYGGSFKNSLPRAIA